MTLFRGLLRLLIGLTLVVVRPGPVLSQRVYATDIDKLLTKVPPCSVLHRELQNGKYGPGREEQYMAAMREQRVQRALLEVSVEWRGTAKNPTIIRELYYDQIDAPDSQITDSSRLSEIAKTGLATLLSVVALERAKAAPVFVGFHGRPQNGRMYSDVEFFADPLLPAEPVLLVPAGKRADELARAAALGDLVGVKRELSSKHHTQTVLNEVLFEAVRSRYNNAAVIRELVSAGANVNARTAEGVTPLMSAVEHPCNIKSLLVAGADIDAKDKWGRTALSLAREMKSSPAMALLAQAPAK